MKKIRCFLAGLLLVPVLAFASPFSTETDVSGLNSTKPLTAICWVYYMGRWVAMPC